MSAISLSKFGENLPATGVTAAAQAAIGFAAGLLVADRLGADNRRRTALIVAGAGLVTLLPIVAGIITRVSNRPGSTRRMRKSLETIRHDTGFSDSDEIV